jgi:hypothetical protein
VSTTTTLAPALLAPAPSSTTPVAHQLLPRYQRRKLDSTDLIDSIDQLGGKLLFTLSLVNSLQEQFTGRAQTTTIDLLDLLEPPIFNGCVKIYWSLQLLKDAPLGLTSTTQLCQYGGL